MRNNINQRLLILVTLLLMLPVKVWADHLEVARLAGLLEHASGNLAFGVSNLQGYNNVRHHAGRLSETAEQLLDSIDRGRTSAYVRIRFTDVARHYERLEAAYLRSGSGRSAGPVHDQFGHVAGIYNNLRLAFYGDGYHQGYLANPQVYIYVPYPRVDSYLPRYEIPRPRPDQDRYDRRDGYDHASSASIRHPDDWRQYDHRSVVQERQSRQGYDHGSAVENRQQGASRGDNSGAASRRSGRIVANQGYTRAGD